MVAFQSGKNVLFHLRSNTMIFLPSAKNDMEKSILENLRRGYITTSLDEKRVEQ